MLFGIFFIGMIALALIGGLRWQAQENHRVNKETFKARLHGKSYNGHWR